MAVGAASGEGQSLSFWSAVCCAVLTGEVAAARTWCKVAFTTTSLCSALNASGWAVLVRREGMRGMGRLAGGAMGDEGELGWDAGGVTGSRSVTTRMVKRGGMEMERGADGDVKDAAGTDCGAGMNARGDGWRAG